MAGLFSLVFVGFTEQDHALLYVAVLLSQTMFLTLSFHQCLHVFLMQNRTMFLCHNVVFVICVMTLSETWM